ncbi:MAG: hypothetical protein KDB53_07470 [Planctomycetes bacterium]|nr:hypothetical protein [Planctomycetota bacterium]
MQGSRSRAGVPLVLALTMVLSGTLVGQFAVSTTFASNNGQAGNMFDIVVTGPNPVTITGFDINANPGTYTVEIWTVDPTAWTAGAGTTQGSILQNTTTATTMAEWVMEANVANVVSILPNAATAVTDSLAPNPNIVSITLNPGETRGFYVTLAANTSIRYTNGTAFGSPAGSDNNLQILEGYGKVYQFGGSFGSPTTLASRVWNGSVRYSAPFTAGVGQAKQSLATLRVNDAREVNGLSIDTIDPMTMSAIRGPFFVNVARNSTIDFRIQGASGQAILLLAGALNPASANFPPIGQLDIGGPVGGGGIPTGLSIVADGTRSTFPDVFFVTGASGQMDIGFNVSGIFPIGTLTTFQALVFTGNPQVIAISNAVQVTITP